MKNKIALLPISLLLLVTACDMKRNLDDMHTSTIEMDKTTAKVEKHSESINNQTGELYDALRQGDALQSRRAALENIKKASDPLRKLSESAKYFMAFEYQLWSGMGEDVTEEKRNILATLAAQEFFKDIEEFIPNGTMTADPFAGQLIATTNSNLVNSLNALSATLQYLNPKQEAKLKEIKGLKMISMYSLIEESLLAKVSIESGKTRIQDYPGYVKEILFSEKEAVYLLQARFNYLPSLIIGKTTDAEYSKIAGTKMLLADWTLDLNNLNTVQISEMNGFLVAAKKTKALLESIGETAPVDPMLARMFSNMKVKKSLKATSSTRTQLEQDFTENLNFNSKP